MQKSPKINNMNQQQNTSFPAQQILTFWLKTLKPQDWFTKNPEIDAEIQKKFATITENAQNNKYDANAMNAHEKLALIITLDQFSRNIYRNSPKAFAGDKIALNLTKELLNKNAHKDFTDDEKTFLYMPLEHSENLDDQKLCVKLFEEMKNEDYVHYAKLHLTIIEKFGRFPHRNEALGRKTTEAEKIFLMQPNSSF